jgi:NAD+ synthase (glutamine-hydrolysing)
MEKTLRLAIAQINCTVGDFKGNLQKISDQAQKAKALGAEIVSFPELAITGYPPEDLLLKEHFIDENLKKLKELARSIRGITAIVGFVDRVKASLFNAAAVIHNGKVKDIYHKILLPNYGVFDEKRYFTAGREPKVFRLGEFLFGVNICEDIWHKEGPTKYQASAGAGLILNINASPYYSGRPKERESAVTNQAKANNVVISYTNLVGGQDELVFDGQGMVVDAAGKVTARLEAFKEDLLIHDVKLPRKRPAGKSKITVITDRLPARPRAAIPKKDVKPLETADEIYQALTLGLRDYVKKNDFKKVVVGLSGGIDSSLVAALAADALGKENVTGVFMPSHYTSFESERDAKELADNLGISFVTVSIEQIFKIYLAALEPKFAGMEKNTAEENLQARIRGNILMALSNKFGWLVLTTGNKSEMSTGYATLYGDMAGGLAVIKDVPKTLVYKLAKYRNAVGAVIPKAVIAKEPTAELKPNQADRDTLPLYEVLDPILKAYIEEGGDIREIVALGYDRPTVCRVLNMVDKSEYKRRQSPPGIKITPKAFGRDRRMPVTNKYKEY